MLYTDFKKRGIGLVEGIDPIKVYPICSVCNPNDADTIINLLTSYGYDLSELHLATFRLFSKDKKQIEELKSVLAQIDELNLKEVFQENLNIISLRRELVARVQNCLTNNIPFLYQDSNVIISKLYNTEAYKEYTAKEKPISVIEPVETVKDKEIIEDNNAVVLTEEDASVRAEIIKTLLEIKEANFANFTLNFIITEIIANIDNIIAKDKQNYRLLGTRHLIEDALEGINLDSEMQQIIDEQILSAFPDNNLSHIERSA